MHWDEAEPQGAGVSLLAGLRSPTKGRKGQHKAKSQAWWSFRLPPNRAELPRLETLLVQDQIHEAM